MRARQGVARDPVDPDRVAGHVPVRVEAQAPERRRRRSAVGELLDDRGPRAVRAGDRVQQRRRGRGRGRNGAVDVAEGAVRERPPQEPAARRAERRRVGARLADVGAEDLGRRVRPGHVAGEGEVVGGQQRHVRAKMLAQRDHQPSAVRADAAGDHDGIRPTVVDLAGQRRERPWPTPVRDADDRQADPPRCPRDVRGHRLGGRVTVVQHEQPVTTQPLGEGRQPGALDVVRRRDAHVVADADRVEAPRLVGSRLRPLVGQANVGVGRADHGDRAARRRVQDRQLDRRAGRLVRADHPDDARVARVCPGVRRAHGQVGARAGTRVGALLQSDPYGPARNPRPCSTARIARRMSTTFGLS